MSEITLTISSRTYSSWSLRGWLMMRMSGLPFKEIQAPANDPDARAELLLLSPSILVPSITLDGERVWDTLAIGELLNELAPEAGMLPANIMQRAHCRAICGEMHSGFSALRSALPMNLKAHAPGFRIWPKAQADIDRIAHIWRDCIARYGGPYLFGGLTIADAMYAPVATRFQTYGVALDPICAAYRDAIYAWPAMQDWIAQAQLEQEEIEELEVEF